MINNTKPLLVKKFISEIIKPVNIEESHKRITENHHFFLHSKPIEYFHKIKEFGLAPRDLGALHNPLISTGLNVPNINEIVCLRPDKSIDSFPNKSKDQFIVAVQSINLPKPVTLDWTCEGSWALADVIMTDNKEKTCIDAFLEVAKRHGTVAVYHTISPNHLKVWARGTELDDPENWPPITNTEFKDILTFNK